MQKNPSGKLADVVNTSPSGNLQLSIQVPLARFSQVWLDFDGTISRSDVLDELIKRYAIDDAWKVAEKCWQDGRIGSRQCLEAQFSSVRIDRPTLERFLDTIQLDSGIHDLLSLFSEHAVPVAILSDGVDFFIKRLLAANKITHLPIRSNTIIHDEDRMALACPHHNERCTSEAAHCKCASAKLLSQDGRRSIYVGDGRSDLCAARQSDLVFAKGTLATCLARENRPFVRYETLHDVAMFLRRGWAPDTRLKGRAVSIPVATAGPTAAITT